MTSIPMMDNILGQVPSLQGVLHHHVGEGRATLQECADLLRSCSGRIIISGMGASFFAAQPAIQALETRGYRVLYAESSELLHYGEGSWHKDDLAILISRSGGSIETLHLAEKLTASKVQYIAVTNIPGSALTHKADQSMLIASQPDELIAIQTYTGTLLALLILVESAAPTNPNIVQECAAAMPMLEAHINVCIEESDRWENFFTGKTPLYLLGRGSAMASIYEGALLFHETAKSATIAMSSGQFRHGPVEVVSHEFRALVIGTPHQTAHLDWQLVTSLRAMGADVRWIGPRVEDAADASLLVRWPSNVPEILQPIFDIVPLQIAAYRTALWLGIRPGDFRYASEITSQESGFPLFEASLR